MKKIFLVLGICFFIITISTAQEAKIDTSFVVPELPRLPLLTDPSSDLHLQLEMPELKNHMEDMMVDSGLYEFDLRPEFSLKDFEQIAPPRFKPGIDFNLGASRWVAPVLGDITIFSPSLNYHFSEDFTVFGGLNFAQYHNLSYIQNIVAPGFPAKSNITADMFVGGAYRVWDRLILQASYQRSLYNQLPNNMMMFAPGQNVVSTGVAVDIWNGLGVMVEHVWEFDDYGRMKKGFRYSPYIDGRKLMKFFGAE